jgi:hypothetical protein
VLWHVTIMLLIVLLLELLGGGISKVVRVHRLVRRKGTAVIHVGGRVLESHRGVPPCKG